MLLPFCKLADVEHGAADLRVVIVDVGAGQDHRPAGKVSYDNVLAVLDSKKRMILAINDTDHPLVLVRVRKGNYAHDIYRFPVTHRASPLSFFGAVRVFSYSASFSFAQSGSLLWSATPRTSVMSHRHRSPEYNSSK